jgi:hypothetical protein
MQMLIRDLKSFLETLTEEQMDCDLVVRNEENQTTRLVDYFATVEDGDDEGQSFLVIGAG